MWIAEPLVSRAFLCFRDGRAYRRPGLSCRLSGGCAYGSPTGWCGRAGAEWAAAGAFETGAEDAYVGGPCQGPRALGAVGLGGGAVDPRGGRSVRARAAGGGGSGIEAGGGVLAGRRGPGVRRG